MVSSLEIDMDIFACQRKAQKDGAFDSATFVLNGPTGSLKCRWLDAYFGMFTVEGHEGFMMASDCEELPLTVSDYQASTTETA